ncbi:MAG: DUF3316 domain-containing protein [Prevotella sp.]|nr:DUF3316 domain-containing protein [Prevotella sp.]
MRSKLMVLFALAALPVAGQETAHLIGIGGTNILDTYISQEKYSGKGLTYLYIREREKPGRRWSSIIEHEADLSSAKDRSRSTSELEADYNLYWGRYRSWHLFGDRLRLRAGGLVNANIGFVYSMSGSNNPAQARVSLNAMPAAVATYGFRLWRQDFKARYELNVPLVGVMFSPNYGQSYYEIFSQGNYDHNIVPTTFVSAPTFRQQLTLDWQAGSRLTLRIGYLGNYQQAAVNNLKQHVLSHRFLIGIVVKR